MSQPVSAPHGPWCHAVIRCKHMRPGAKLLAFWFATEADDNRCARISEHSVWFPRSTFYARRRKLAELGWITRVGGHTWELSRGQCCRDNWSPPRFFRAYRSDGNVALQGVVHAERGDDWWTVYEFDWVFGEMTGPHEIDPREYEIRFYSTDVEMREAV